MISTLTSIVIASAVGSSTWTVDDNGPADFSSIHAAIPVIAENDILLVKAGSYPGFTASKSVIILGPPTGLQPTITTPVSIQAAANFTLAGLRLTKGLVANGVAGRLTIDECTIEGIVGIPTVQWNSCGDVLFSRSSAVGAKQTVGIVCTTSNARIDSSSIRGGEYPDYTTPYGGDGALALSVASHSRVVLSGTTVNGGFAGYADVGVQGTSGGAVRAADGSLVIIRGLSAHLIATGGWSPFGTPGPALELLDTSRIIVSGVTVLGPNSVASTATLQFPSSPSPWMRIVGNDGPGQVRRIHLFGPPATPALLLVGTAPGILAHPLAGLPLWMSPLGSIAVVPVTTQSATIPLEFLYAVPSTPGVAGTTLEIQAAFPTLSGTVTTNTIEMTNGTTLLLRE